MASGNNWSSALLQKEEEYKRLNAELESRTANLVREAETVLRQNEAGETGSVQKKGNLLDNVNPDEIASDEDAEVQFNASQGRSAISAKSKPSKIPSARQKSASSAAGKSKAAKSSSKPDANAASSFDADAAFLTDFQRDLAGRMAEMEGEVKPEDPPAEDVLPTAAQDMGPEAQMRFLKAKVRVSEEEAARLQAEVHKLQEENRKLTQRAKEAEEERGKATRSTHTLQTQLEKHRKAAEEATSRADGLDKQLAGMRRELDQLRRQEKQQAAGGQAAEVRLNRALEEAEKYKAELAKARAAKKDAGESEKRRADALMQENKKLERQKNDLISGFRKQMKLIDILKRQRMHLEAAKMLQFTEEEFVKALDWEKG